jgi:hypothetical protein
MGKFLQKEHVLEDPEAIVESEFNGFAERVADEFLIDEYDKQTVEGSEVVVQSLEEDGISQESFL